MPELGEAGAAAALDREMERRGRGGGRPEVPARPTADPDGARLSVEAAAAAISRRPRGPRGRRSRARRRVLRAVREGRRRFDSLFSEAVEVRILYMNASPRPTTRAAVVRPSRRSSRSTRGNPLARRLPGGGGDPRRGPRHPRAEGAPRQPLPGGRLRGPRRPASGRLRRRGPGSDACGPGLRPGATHQRGRPGDARGPDRPPWPQMRKNVHQDLRRRFLEATLLREQVVRYLDAK